MSADRAEIAKLRADLARVTAELEEAKLCISNQEALITGHHKYVGQDFQFRLEKVTAELKDSNDDADMVRIALRTTSKALDEMAKERDAYKRDAERYHTLQSKVSAERTLDGQYAFKFTHIPTASNLFRGSVAQHLDEALDAMQERDDG